MDFFAKSLDRSGFSVVAESNFITKKIYFPRLIIPLSATLGGLLDFAIAFLLLVAMMVWFGVLPTWKLVMVPLYLLLTVMASLAVSLWFSALFVKYRDIAAVSSFDPSLDVCFPDSVPGQHDSARMAEAL